MTDESNGYEGIAPMYIKARGQSADGIGSSTVRAWAKTLNRGAIVLDVGCGTGIPVTKILLDEGLFGYALDASPVMIKTFRQNFPGVPAACEGVERSPFFHRSFDAIIAVGLIFLLTEAAQRALVHKMAAALNPGGSLLFTAPLQKVEWKDVMTDRTSVSLGAAQYRELIAAAGLSIAGEFEDEGGNYYFNAVRPVMNPIHK